MKLLVLATAALSLGGAAPDPAATMDELLAEVRDARRAEQKLDAEREADFLSRRDRQAQLLREAEARRAALEAKSRELSAQFDSQEAEIARLGELLSQRQGNLGELFGVTRQVAGDVATVLSQSLVSAQHPGREDGLSRLAASKELPSIQELERMWFEMTREMTETGRVVRFEAAVAAADGQSRKAEVVRIGPFTALAGGSYAVYQPSSRQLVTLGRQPGGDLPDLGHRLEAAASGYVPAAIDPSRGVLLALSVERPSVVERIERGELVGYVIIAVGLLGAALAVFQLGHLLRTRLLVKRQLSRLDQPTPDNPVGRVLLAYKGEAAQLEADAGVVELRLSEAVLREVPALERFQGFLRLAVAAGPLLGLIGTVIGMIVTFQSITESGSSDPRLMATGIGQAMIATVLGLGIAIPLLFVNAGLATLSRQIVQILDEQSAGLLAQSLEQRRLETGARRG